MNERDELADRVEAVTPISAGDAESIADAILAAGYRKPFNLSPGLYRNKLGAEIEVRTLETARHIIGSVWNAFQKDDLFPRHLLVTPEGMRDAGYERVEPS